MFSECFKSMQSTLTLKVPWNCLIAGVLFQLVTEEKVAGVVTLNEDWELEDFCNTEQVHVVVLYKNQEY